MPAYGMESGHGKGARNGWVTGTPPDHGGDYAARKDAPVPGGLSLLDTQMAWGAGS